MLVLPEVLPHHDKQVNYDFYTEDNLLLELLMHEELAVAPAISLQKSGCEDYAGV
jgi:hypothetical protein